MRERNYLLCLPVVLSGVPAGKRHPTTDNVYDASNTSLPAGAPCLGRGGSNAGRFPPLQAAAPHGVMAVAEGSMQMLCAHANSMHRIAHVDIAWSEVHALSEFRLACLMRQVSATLLIVVHLALPSWQLHCPPALPSMFDGSLHDSVTVAKTEERSAESAMAVADPPQTSLPAVDAPVLAAPVLAALAVQDAGAPAAVLCGSRGPKSPPAIRLACAGSVPQQRPAPVLPTVVVHQSSSTDVRNVIEPLSDFETQVRLQTIEVRLDNLEEKLDMLLDMTAHLRMGAHMAMM